MKLFKPKDPTAGKSSNKKLAVRFPFTGMAIPPTWKVIDRYALNAPFAYAVVAQDPGTGSRKYFLDEVLLTTKEAAIYTYLLETLESELTVPRGSVDPRTYFTEQARRIVTKYSINASQTSWPKIFYFAERDLVGFGALDGLMRDPHIEDISADGVNRPLFIYQRKFENLETNVVFRDDEIIDNLVSRLAHMAGKHVSTAFPIVQGTLPGRHRLSATFRREVSPYGGTFTIRKFREDPLTIIDMLNFNVIDHNLAAYVWFLMENRATAIVAGSTGSGKTTLLNSLLTLTRMNNKIVTIEEVQEINIAHSNWTALVSRESYGTMEDAGRGVGLFDLVKTAMRMRPDILVVGEVRGEEAYVLFQAIASVTGDTPVLVRENNQVRLKSIHEVVDPFYPGETERVPIPVKGIDVLTFDNGNKVTFKPIRYVLRHKADEIYKIRYTGGEVKATGSHSVFVFRDDCELVAKPVSELRQGEILASFCGSDEKREAPELDVESILRQSNPARVVTQRIAPQCPFCATKRTWRRGKVDDSRRYTCSGCKRSFADDREGLIFHDMLEADDGTRLVSLTRSSSIPAKIPVDEQFARVLGIYMADGCVKHHRGGRIVFSLSSSEKQPLANEVQEFFSRFGVNACVDDRGTYMLLEFNHTPFALVFEALCGRELNEKRVPSLMWSAPREIVNAFLDGWRADSRRTVRGKFVSFTSARSQLINELSWLSRLHGHTSLISERSSRYRSVQVSKTGIRQKSESIPAEGLLFKDNRDCGDRCRCL
ncbi:MAG: Flp pilus assembly complex ATPase component TadA [Thaumarchaeota archaeon]|nr:Flp pilus assembly complex ATPase component TadA [Nitrososphaerota archaeon]